PGRGPPASRRGAHAPCLFKVIRKGERGEGGEDLVLRGPGDEQHGLILELVLVRAREAPARGPMRRGPPPRWGRRASRAEPGACPVGRGVCAVHRTRRSGGT